MKINVKCRSKERKEFIEKCAKFFAKELKLNKSKYVTNIHSVSNLIKHRGSNGEVAQFEHNHELYIFLDTRLSISQLLVTLAHEMVHIKQIAKGQYKGKIDENGRTAPAWRGVIVRARYLKRPWEIEALDRQLDLVEKLFKYVVQKKNKKG